MILLPVSDFYRLSVCLWNCNFQGTVLEPGYVMQKVEGSFTFLLNSLPQICSAAILE